MSAACAIWETQVAASLRVGSLQCAVFGESQEFGTEPQNSAQGTAERRYCPLMAAGGRVFANAEWPLFY